MQKIILIAADNELILRALHHELHKQDYKVLLAKNGMEAITLFCDEEPDLVVVDFFMAEINGDFICRIIKKNPEAKNIPVILLTDKKEELNEFWGADAGADHFFSRQEYDPNLLLKTIDNLINTAPKKITPLNVISLFSKMCKKFNNKLYLFSAHKSIATFAQISERSIAFKQLFELIIYVSSFEFGYIRYTHNNETQIYPHKNIPNAWINYLCEKTPISKEDWLGSKYSELKSEISFDNTQQAKSLFYQKIMFKGKEIAHFVLLSKNEQLSQDDSMEALMDLMITINLFITIQKD